MTTTETEDTQLVPLPLMPTAGDWTVDDLDRMPEDDLRYELIGGLLCVSPVPTRLHQRAVLQLTVGLRNLCPDGMQVLLGPLDYRPDPANNACPDALVVRNEEVAEKNITRPPQLAVEVLGDAGRIKDSELKRELYERTGVASFWVVDPDVPSLVAYDLVDGVYAEVARGTGPNPVSLTRPFPVTIVPAALVET